MKTLIYTLLSAAMGCGCNCKTAFAQNQDKPFGVVSTKVIDLKVTGMTCQGCADHVTATLSEKKGIVKSDVQFAENKAFVTYDPNVIKPEEIIKAIEEIGYKAESTTVQDAKRKARQQQLLMPVACPKRRIDFSTV